MVYNISQIGCIDTPRLGKRCIYKRVGCNFKKDIDTD